MGKYTLKGSPELDARIDLEMAHITELASPHARAGVLIGGYGRGEGTPLIQTDGSQAPFNDYDLVVVVDRLNSSVRNRFRILEARLSEQLSLPVDLCPYALSHLRSCEFSLLNYEMKQGHKVIWGEESILNALPEYPPDAIPLSEGMRLLLNRGKLLIDIRQRLAQAAPLSEEERVRFIKFIHKVLLAFGDCALLAAEEYDISYAVKKVRFPSIGHCPDRQYVVEGYLKAIELKEWGDFQALSHFNIKTEFQIVRDVFLRFVPWYRSYCSGREGSVPKNLILNLKWNRRLSTKHPREPLYDQVTDLLQRRHTISAERFYRLQRRFS